MKYKGIILFIFAILIFLFIYFYERKIPTTQEIKERENKIFNLKKEDINFLSYKGNEMSWEVKKGKDEWRILKPINYKADEFTINNILDDLIEMEKIEELKDINLKDYGLLEPIEVFSFSTKNGIEEIIIGTQIPGINQLAIRLKKREKNYLISSNFLSKIKKNLTELRDKTIFSYQTMDVNYIEIETRKRKINLEKKEEQWYLDFPFKDRAEKDNVEDLLFGLSSLKAKEFIDDYNEEKLKELNLFPPLSTICFYDKDKNLILKADFGKKEGMEKNDFYVKSGMKVFLASHSFWEKLEEGLVAIPDTKILSFHKWEAKKFSIKINGNIYNFEKKDFKWFKGETELKDENPLENILKELEELKWIQSIKELKDLEEICEFNIEGEKFKINCKIYKDKALNLWAKPSDRPNYWSFPGGVWERIKNELEKLKEKEEKNK